MSSFPQDLHLNFHSFLGFQHASGSSVKVIMRLLPLAIGLKCFWLLIALLLQLRSTDYLSMILRSLPTKPVFKRILAKAFCHYILNLMSKKKLGSFNDLVFNTYFQSLIYVCPSMVCHDILGITVSLALLSKIQPILERLNKNITKPWKPSIIDRSNKWC